GPAEAQRFHLLGAGRCRDCGAAPAPGPPLIGILLPAKAGIAVQAEGGVLPGHRDLPVFVADIAGALLPAFTCHGTSPPSFFARMGRHTVNAVPLPSALSTEISPSISCRTRRARDSP